MSSTLNIKICGNEQEIIEGLLNMASSGRDTSLSLAFVALGMGWHIDKLTYYQNLIWDVLEVSDDQFTIETFIKRSSY